MTRAFSLSYLTCLDEPPPKAVVIASQAGYDFVGFRLLPAAPGGLAHNLMDDPGSLAETLTAMRDTGMRVFDLELIRLNDRFKAQDYLRFFEVGAKLGAHSVLVAGDDADEARSIGSFGALCRAAAQFGLSADLEFMPQTQVRDVAAALRILEQAGQPNSALIVDALHFARCGSSLAELAAIPRRWMNYLQICDAPAEIPASLDGLNYTARRERLLPGEGEIDLVEIFGALPRDLPISVEIPNEKQAPAHGPIGWARRALDASKALLANVPASQTA